MALQLSKKCDLLYRLQTYIGECGLGIGSLALSYVTYAKGYIMSLQPHEVALSHKEQDELNAEIAYEAFKPDAIERVKECLDNDGDLMDLINTLDLEYDEYENLSNEQINEIVFSATSSILIEKGLL